jgi:hypothetical protein
MTSAMTVSEMTKRTPVAMNRADTPTFLATINAVGAQQALLPAVWRVNYLHEAPSPEMPEIAHEKARQILHENLSRAGLWKRP